MRVSWSLRRWLRLPSRLALLLGLGALSAAGAQANTAEVRVGNEPTRVPQQSAKSFGELLIWSDGGRIYVSESGKEAQELRLGDTAEARHLKQLLERDGAAPDSPRALPHRMILVGGGGEGIHWERTRQPDSSDQTGGSDKVSSSGKTNPSAQTGTPGKTHIAGAKDSK
jgi:hypothetical protein